MKKFTNSEWKVIPKMVLAVLAVAALFVICGGSQFFGGGS